MKQEFISLLKNSQTRKICHFKDCEVFMQAIDENDEKTIDDHKDDILGYIFKLSNGTTINCKKIILYGDIDLNNKTDINVIEYKKNKLINLDAENIINSNFDYDEGGYYTMRKPPIPSQNKDEEYVKGWCPTFNVVKWIKYNHCCLGKPKKIIIYEH